MTILGCTYCAGQMALAGLAFALRDWRDLQLAVSTPFLAIALLSWSVQCGVSFHGRPVGVWVSLSPHLAGHILLRTTGR